MYSFHAYYRDRASKACLIPLTSGRGSDCKPPLFLPVSYPIGVKGFSLSLPCLQAIEVLWPSGAIRDYGRMMGESVALQSAGRNDRVGWVHIRGAGGWGNAGKLNGIKYSEEWQGKRCHSLAAGVLVRKQGSGKGTTAAIESRSCTVIQEQYTYSLRDN